MRGGGLMLTLALEREVTRLDWFTPYEALDAFKNKRIYLPPPTYITLQQLSKFPLVKDLLASLLNQMDTEYVALLCSLL
jgi:hypothetical protein